MYTEEERKAGHKLLRDERLEWRGSLEAELKRLDDIAAAEKSKPSRKKRKYKGRRRPSWEKIWDVVEAFAQAGASPSRAVVARLAGCCNETVRTWCAENYGGDWDAVWTANLPRVGLVKLADTPANSGAKTGCGVKDLPGTGIPKPVLNKDDGYRARLGAALAELVDVLMEKVK